MTIKIKEWFKNREFTSNERIAISTADGCEIEKETEKAFFVKWNTEYGTIKKWMPKSVCEICESIENTEVFTEGMTVKHSTFGVGEIKSINGIVAVINFPCGEKTVVTTAAPMTAC